MGQRKPRPRHRDQRHKSPDGGQRLVSGRAIVMLGIAFAVIAVERLLSAALVVATPASEVSTRLLIAFLCGGLAPLLVLLGYLKDASDKTARSSLSPTE